MSSEITMSVWEDDEKITISFDFGGMHYFGHGYDFDSAIKNLSCVS